MYKHNHGNNYIHDRARKKRWGYIKWKYKIIITIHGRSNKYLYKQVVFIHKFHYVTVAVNNSRETNVFLYNSYLQLCFMYITN